MARIIDAVAERFYRFVVNLESNDLHSAFFVHDPFADILGYDSDAFRRKAVIGLPNPNVILKRQLELATIRLVRWGPKPAGAIYDPAARTILSTKDQEV